MGTWKDVRWSLLAEKKGMKERQSILFWNNGFNSVGFHLQSIPQTPVTEKAHATPAYPSKIQCGRASTDPATVFVISTLTRCHWGVERTIWPEWQWEDDSKSQHTGTDSSMMHGNLFVDLLEQFSSLETALSRLLEFHHWVLQADTAQATNIMTWNSLAFEASSASKRCHRPTTERGHYTKSVPLPALDTPAHKCRSFISIGVGNSSQISAT